MNPASKLREREKQPRRSNPTEINKLFSAKDTDLQLHALDLSN